VGAGLAARRALAGAVALLSALLAGDAATQPAREIYPLLYDVRFVPTERSARVTIAIAQNARLVKWIELRTDPARHQQFRGTGKIEEVAGGVRWTPPATGAELQYTFRIDHLRDERSYDGRSGGSFALFRGDDLVPPARVRTEDDARSQARLRLRLPSGWSAAVPYPRLPDGTYSVEHADRRFDRPTGWMVAGHLGVVREKVAGVRVAIAAPKGHGLHYLDLLALLRWTLPSLREAAGELPERLLVVGAGDPMWRGGLSGRSSVYVHADRPLIESDGTSPLLHELVHTVMRARSGRDGDWIVEGLAELYSVEVLARSGTIGKKRHQKVLARIEARGKGVAQLGPGPSSGSHTARAVTVLRELDARIRADTQGARSLDDVLRAMVRTPEAWTVARFRSVAERTTGLDLESFFRRVATEGPAARRPRSEPTASGVPARAGGARSASARR
jgi:hypothetical protein